MKSNYLLRLLVFSTLAAICPFAITMAQQTTLCGTDIMTQKLLTQHPELLQQYANYETYTQNYVKNYEAVKQQSEISNSRRPAGATAPTVYIIPIVFHILHEDGPENITEAQILDEMRILNEDWGHTNPDTGDAVTAHFKAIEGNIQVQFRLAQVDPNGKPTNGIDRIYTNLTNNATDSSKLHPWDRSKYLNVWVCKAINDVASKNATTLGYAYFPWEVDATPSIDGVLIVNYCVGSIGTSSLRYSRCLSHEIGHVMNLEHPWGMTNAPGVLGPYQYSNPVTSCGDDGVEDTPLTRGFFSYCPTVNGNDAGGAINYADTIYGAICDTVSRDTISKNPLNIKYHIATENFQNFMDYSECAMMFTVGQQERIWAALNSTASNRSNLWDTANLIATGVFMPPTTVAPPVANFYSNICLVCQGASVRFYDAAVDTEKTNWLWTFTGATVNTSNVENPIITFDSLWSQTVSLTATNKGGSNTQTQNGYIYVSPSWTTYIGTFSEGFENPSEINTNWILLNTFNTPAHWQYTNTAAASGTGSLMLNAYQHSVRDGNYSPALVTTPSIGPDAVWDAISPSVNLQNASEMSLSFDYSCATKAMRDSDIAETLEIDYSLNCGASWSPLKTLSGPTLTNAGHWNTFFTPNSPSDWTNIVIPLGAILNGKPNVRFRFEFTSSDFNNNIYLDNINLSGVLGIDAVTNENYHLSVYPNPMSNAATISYYLPLNQPVNIGLYDVTGRELKQLANGNQTAGQHTININNGDVSNGIYFIKLVTANNQSVTKKLIVIN